MNSGRAQCPAVHAKSFHELAEEVSSTTIDVHGDILSWARERSGYDLETASSKLKLDADVLAALETGETSPSPARIREMAHLYRVSPAVFFLDEVPTSGFVPPKDFRSLPGNDQDSFSPAIRKEIDRVLARNYTFIAKADLENGGWVVMYPDLPGVMTQAETYEEVPVMAKDALRAWVEAQIEDGRPIPEPSDFEIPEWNWEAAGEPLMTTAEVAKEFDVTPRRILALAEDRDVGRRYGRSVMFTKRDVDRLRPGPSGRPKKKAVRK